MSGMSAMSGAVEGLKELPQFGRILLIFNNPLLGVLIGTLITAAIQSSAASIGMLQSLALTGQVTWGAAIPIVMGQNIGTTITALISAVGATKNGKRAALAHLTFNVFGTVIWTAVFWLVKIFVQPVFLTESISIYSVALCHTVFNVLTMLLVLPITGLLQKFVEKIVPDKKGGDNEIELDERLLVTPALAVEQCRILTVDMASLAVESLSNSMKCLFDYSKERADAILEDEERTDHYEDVISSFLVKVSRYDISNRDSREAAMLLKAIGDFERISDHAVNLLEAAQEIKEKNIQFSGGAEKELKTITSAVDEILNLSYLSFVNNSLDIALTVEPLESVIDDLRDELRGRHIERLQRGECTVDAGFVWSDILTDLERTSDHCSNVAGAVIDISHHNMNLHESLRTLKSDSEEYRREYAAYSEKYSV